MDRNTRTDDGVSLVFPRAAGFLQFSQIGFDFCVGVSSVGSSELRQHLVEALDYARRTGFDVFQKLVIDTLACSGHARRCSWVFTRGRCMRSGMPARWSGWDADFIGWRICRRCQNPISSSSRCDSRRRSSAWSRRWPFTS